MNHYKTCRHITYNCKKDAKNIDSKELKTNEKILYAGVENQDLRNKKKVRNY